MTSLIEEYQAAEKADYLSWGSGGAPAAGIASSYVARGQEIAHFLVSLMFFVSLCACASVVSPLAVRRR